MCASDQIDNLYQLSASVIWHGARTQNTQYTIHLAQRLWPTSNIVSCLPFPIPIIAQPRRAGRGPAHGITVVNAPPPVHRLPHQDLTLTHLSSPQLHCPPPHCPPLSSLLLPSRAGPTYFYLTPSHYLPLAQVPSAAEGAPPPMFTYSRACRMTFRR
jgi:hypothetical protein